jgi:hypothetical protein
MVLVASQGVLVRLIWSTGGVPSMVNVVGASGLANTAVNQALANSLGSAIKAQLTTSGQHAAVHTSVALANVGVRSIHVPSQVEYLDTNPPAPGSGTGSLLPPQIACCITLRTALAGKEFRGRVYLGGYATVANDTNGQMTVSIGPFGVAFVEGIQDALTANGLTLHVISRKNNTSQIVTGIQSRDTVWETQRRRALAGI